MELKYSPWKIEQTAFSPEEEAEVEEQLTLSNGYLSQGAFFEEYYPGGGERGTWLRGIENPLPPLGTISVRLHEDRLSLAEWKTTEFYRCLYRDRPKLDRSVTAVSPAGPMLKVYANRLLLTNHPHVMEVWYKVVSMNYRGPISFLSLMGDGNGAYDWYPIASEVYPEKALMCLQSRSEDVQAGLMMTMELWKNGEAVDASPIRIEKQYIIGYSVTEKIEPGDLFFLRKRVAVTDSLNYPAASQAAALEGYLNAVAEEEKAKAEAEQAKETVKHD